MLAPTSRPRPTAGAALLAALALVCATGWAARAPAQTIAGHLLDAETGDPIPAMDVLLRDVRGDRIQRALSDGEGRFWFAVDDPGMYRVAVARLGYDSTATAELGVARDQDVFIEIRVRPVAVGAEPITVRARREVPYLELQGFYGRRRRGMGSFIPPEEVGRIPGRPVTAILRRVAGVRVTDGAVQIRGTGSVSLACTPLVVIDDYPVHDVSRTSIDDLVPPGDAEAIEIYRGPATVPPRWRGRAPCGVVAIWTKH
jgi:hypothetical protein